MLRDESICILIFHLIFEVEILITTNEKAKKSLGICLLQAKTFSRFACKIQCLLFLLDDKISLNFMSFASILASYVNKN